MTNDKSWDYPDQAGLMILPWVSLFPGAMMPLKIFEDRYQEMLRLSLAGNRMFAIAHTSGEEDECENLGAIGMIRACVQNDDGTSNLVLQGVSRLLFKGVQLDPYPHSQIEVMSDSLESTPGMASLRKKIKAIFQERATEELEIPEGYILHLDTITRHGAFTDLVASSVVQSPEARRLLLEELDVTARMEMLLALLADGNPE